MSTSLIVADCPECRAVGTVILGTCSVCFAEFVEGEDDDGLSVGHVGNVVPLRPRSRRTSTYPDPARGIVTGLLVSTTMWLLGTAAWWLFIAS